MGDRRAADTVRRSWRLGVVALAAFAVWPILLGSGNQPELIVSDAVQLLAAALAAVACAGRARKDRSLGWLLIASSAAAWAVGQALWTWWEVVDDTATPFPSVADIGYLTALPLMLAGVLILGFAGGFARRWPHLATEAAVIVTSLAFVVWQTVLLPLDRSDETGGARVLLIVYPVVSAAVVAVALLAVLNRRTRRLELAAIGSICVAVADGGFTYQTADASFTTGSWPDLLWVIGFVVIAAAAFQRPPLRERDNTAAPALLGYAPALAALIVGIGRVMSEEPTSLTAQILVVAIATAVLLNQVSAYAENSRLQRSLRTNLRELARSEERFRLVLDDLAEVVLVLGGDGMVRSASRRITEMLGFTPAAVAGRSVFALVHPDDEAAAMAGFADLLNDRFPDRPFALRARAADGSVVWVEANAVNLLSRPEVDGVVISLRDITERRRSQAVLIEAQQRFRAAFEAAPIGMLVTELEVNVDSRIVEANAAFGRMVGHAPDALVGRSMRDLVHPDDWVNHRDIFAALAAGELRTVTLEKRYLRADGRVVWTSESVSVVDQPDGRRFTIRQVEDVTQRRAIALRLEYSARHDDVTGLNNRACFIECLDRALQRSSGRGPVAVVFLDLDRFKVVNDSLGHAAGDDLLRVIGGRIRRAVRPSDVVARFGGDEFTVLLADVPSDAVVMQLAERVATTIAEPVPLSDGDTYVSASIGVAVSDRGGVTADSLLQDADAAMYRAKERGRNRIERFDAEARASVSGRLRTGNDLHRALQRGELGVDYQPVVALATGRITGFEALARWNHPERGVLDPHEFIALAEDTGLIIPMGFVVIREAFGQVAQWQAATTAAKDLSVSVNLSARQLASAGLVTEVAEVITESGIDPDRVWLEITESALMTDAKAAAVTLRALRGLGVHLSVDDFGTGYSSLTYLQRFPVEGLKIDQSFVDGLGIDAGDTTIVDTLIRLGHSLALSVVAEGLETPLQLTHLRRLGCDYAQGFLFSNPQPAASVSQLLDGWLDAPVA